MNGSNNVFVRHIKRELNEILKLIADLNRELELKDNVIKELSKELQKKYKEMRNNDFRF